MPTAKEQAKRPETVMELVARLVREAPHRPPASEGERRAQEIVGAEFEALGLQCATQPFEFGPDAYSNFALHMGMMTAGTVVSAAAPALAFLLHAGAAASYWSESVKRMQILRRLLPVGRSQNLLATAPAQGEAALRIVFMAHTDAACTGWTFDPGAIRSLSGGAREHLGFFQRPMKMATTAGAVLAGIDLLRMAFGPSTYVLRPLEVALTLPAAVTAALTLEVVLRNEVVPGANDDLSGVAAMVELARRLVPEKPPEVELVFVATGCEEAQWGGAEALARAQEGVWDKQRTVLLALDSMTNGELRYGADEGEIERVHPPGWLSGLIVEVAASDPRFDPLRRLATPVGGTDAVPFLVHGWDAVGLVCVDPKIGAPRHYHLPSDTPENLDPEILDRSVDYVEALARAIIERRS